MPDNRNLNSQPQGRLELTWTNKHEALIAHDDGGYEWVAPDDYRVNEVRLLHDAVTVGAVHPSNRRAKDNLLIRGDALHALTAISENPEFSDEYKGKVKLVYIDPPFNTGQAFAQYDDDLEHSVWLTMMRDRLKQIFELLADDGTIWVHLDDAESAYARVILDEVFGRKNFLATITWEKADSPRMDARTFSARHDHIHVFAKSSAATIRRLPLEASQQSHFRLVDDAGRNYRKVLLRKTGSNSLRREGPSGWFPIAAPDGSEAWPLFDDGTEGTWRWGRERVQRESEMLEWDKKSDRWVPYVRQYADAQATKPPETIWAGADVGYNRTGKHEIRRLSPAGLQAFATPKPERLLERVIHLATEPGDMVLDCFAGSGTTAAVAHKMGRRWVTVEWSETTLANFTEPRLRKVVAGQDDGGVSSAQGWLGGGSFRVVDVAPSMFDASADGEVYLAHWATGTALAEAAAAQFGFTYEQTEAPFCGRKGRMRLAVIDGLVSPEVVDIVVSALGRDERVKLVGTAVDPAARKRLAETSKGSQIRTVPGAMLKEYERSSALRAAIEARRIAERANEGQTQLMLGEMA